MRTLVEPVGQRQSGQVALTPRVPATYKVAPSREAAMSRAGSVVILAACERAPEPTPEMVEVTGDEDPEVQLLLAEDGSLSFKMRTITDPELRTILDMARRLYERGGPRSHRSQGLEGIEPASAPRRLRVLLRASPGVPHERLREVVGTILSEEPKELRVLCRDPWESLR